jgi:hypothetical protein
MGLGDSSVIISGMIHSFSFINTATLTVVRTASILPPTEFRLLQGGETACYTFRGMGFPLPKNELAVGSNS